MDLTHIGPHLDLSPGQQVIEGFRTPSRDLARVSTAMCEGWVVLNSIAAFNAIITSVRRRTSVSLRQLRPN